MSFLCDVHCLLHPREDRADTQQKLIDAMANEPVNFHMVNDGRNVSVAKLNAYKIGCAKYVSAVDDDDMFIPGIFQKCMNIMEGDDSIDAVSTRELVIRDGVEKLWTDRHIHKFKGKALNYVRLLEDGEIITMKDFFQIHHIVVARRSSVNKYIDLEEVKNCDYTDFSLWKAMIQGGCKFMALAEIGYIWNNHIRTKEHRQLSLRGQQCQE